jgi:hypothetical protein
MEIVILSVLLLVGVAYGYYTASGSGIAEPPYRQGYSGAPGGLGARSASGRDDRVSMDSRTCGTHLPLAFAALTAAMQSKM